MRAESGKQQFRFNRFQLLASATLCAAGFSFLLHRSTPLHLIAPLLITSIVITWPFSVKGTVGRRWWAATAGYFGGLVGALALGPGSPFAWLLLNLSVGCWACAAYLHWNPPQGLDEDGRPNPE